MDFSFGGHSLNLQLAPRAIAFRKLFLAFSYEVRAALFSLFFLIYGSMLFVWSRYTHASSNVTTSCHLRDAVHRPFSRL
ncbi:hypothetical protein C0J52_01682 [Blattella germanica]|nr:hypothetical protein C0J52_01682 [Blattella germanica]